MQAIGHSGFGFRGARNSGISRAALPNSMGGLNGTAKANEVGIYSIRGLTSGPISMGVYFQISNGGTVHFTLANPSDFLSEVASVRASVVWCNPLTVPANTIVQAPMMFSGFKITIGAADSDWHVIVV